MNGAVAYALFLFFVLVAIGLLFAPWIEGLVNRQRISTSVRGERHVVVLIDCEDCSAEGWPSRQTLSDDPRRESCARCGGTHFIRVGGPTKDDVDTALKSIAEAEARRLVAINRLRLACGLQPSDKEAGHV